VLTAERLLLPFGSQSRTSGAIKNGLLTITRDEALAHRKMVLNRRTTPDLRDSLTRKAVVAPYGPRMDPVLYGPGEGEHHDAGPAQIVIKAAGEHTGGSFFLAERTLAPGFAGPPPHRHRGLHDMFYVLELTG
jgi:hypothetical protein